MPKVSFTMAAGASLLLASCTNLDATQTGTPAVSMFHPVVPGAPATTPQPAAPSGNAVWMPASFEWNGTTTTYVLQPGSWSQNVAPAAMWQAGHWVPVPGQTRSYQWVKGQWVVM